MTQNKTIGQRVAEREVEAIKGISWNKEPLWGLYIQSFSDAPFYLYLPSDEHPVKTTRDKFRKWLAGQIDSAIAEATKELHDRVGLLECDIEHLLAKARGFDSPNGVEEIAKRIGK